MKKVTLIIFILFLLIKPYGNAFASATTVPEGYEVPAGIYAVASLITGGIAANNTVTDSQEVYEIAKTVWTMAEPTVKQEFKEAIDFAVATGSSIVQLPATFQNWYMNEATLGVLERLEKPPFSDSQLGTLGMTLDNTSVTMFGGGSFQMYWVNSGWTTTYSITPYAGGSYIKLLTPNGNYQNYASSEVITAIQQQLETKTLSNYYNVIMQIAAILGVTVNVNNEPLKHPIDNWADQVGKGLENVFNNVKTKGISIPLAGIGALVAGQPATWDKDLGKYKLVDGTVYNEAEHGPIAWDVPKVNVKTNTDGTIVLNPTNELPVIETTVGGIAFPVLDTDFPIPNDYVGNPPIEGDIPIEGTVGTADLLVPSTATLNFQPLVNVFGDVTTKFPFSIPWDLKKQLSVFNIQPETPKIDIDFSKFPYAKAGTKLTIDLSFMNPLAAAARWALTIAIDIAFILMLRRLLPE